MTKSQSLRTPFNCWLGPLQTNSNRARRLLLPCTRCWDSKHSRI